ncbi:MAG: heme A synthase [Myxococcales bacterium]|nr:heme A synthase [Myxococcales bacterium]
MVEQRNYQSGLALFAKVTVFATFLLLIAGAMVTSTDSGLAVPDWPLSYGMLMPPMVGGIFYEHGHRMVATAVGLLMTILAIWLWRKDPRPWMRKLGVAGFGLVVLQGVLGGVTVLFLLPVAISSLHAAVAQTFFLFTIAIAYFTSAEYHRPTGATIAAGDGPPLTRLGLALIGAIYVQLVLGAVMRHSGAGLAIPDFPLAFGRLIPPFDREGVAIHFAHRAWGVVVAAATLALTAHVLRRYPNAPALRRPAAALGLMVVVQVLLGGATIWTGRHPWVASAHLATGALILATTWLLTLRAYRWVQGAERARSFASAAPEAT